MAPIFYNQATANTILVKNITYATDPFVDAAQGILNFKPTLEPIVIELKITKGVQVIINGEEK